VLSTIEGSEKKRTKKLEEYRITN